MYLFDGVSAHPELETQDDDIFTFVWAAPDEEVWAVAQTGRKVSAPSTVRRYDGQQWTVVSDTPSERVDAFAAIDASHVFVAQGQTIRRFDGSQWREVYTLPAGAVRDCSFAKSDRGYCTGTNGFAAAWDGSTFVPVSGAPWSARAEILGAVVTELSDAVTFLYAEPKSNGPEHTCRAARLRGSTWTNYAASVSCYPSYDVPRKRVAHVVVGGSIYPIVAPDGQFGGSLLFDAEQETWRSVCGPALTFAVGGAQTRAGGAYGLLGTLVGSGSGQVALVPFGSTALDFKDLAVARDGTAWARSELSTACESVTDQLHRFEGSAWKSIPGPTFAVGGDGLAAVSQSELLTISTGSDEVVAWRDGEWSPLFPYPTGRAIWAAHGQDVWVGSATRDSFGHYDGTSFEVLRDQRGRQIEQVVATSDGDAWLIARGFTESDTNLHVYHYDHGSFEEWNLGLEREAVHVAARDRAHAWMSGSPAKAWDGSRWNALPFSASGVWARSEDEVWFSQGGDIVRWDGHTAERKYHGFVPIMHMTGSDTRGFAVGRGGLTIEYAEMPIAPH